MKKSLILFLILISSVAFSANFPAKFTGDVKVGNKQMLGAKVQVYFNNDIIFSTTVKDFGFILKLEFDTDYKIKVSNAGYLSPVYSISTTVPASEKGKTFEFDLGDIQLVEDYPGIDKSVFEKPVAKISFNPNKKSFELDKIYEAQVNAKIEALKQEIADAKSGKNLTASTKPEIVPQQSKTENPKSETKEAPKANANNSIAENIEKLDDAKGDDQKTADLLHNIGKQQYNNNDLSKAKENLEKALDLKQKIGDKSGEADVLKDIAAINFDEGNFDKAIKNFDNAADLKIQTGDKLGAAYAYNDMALISADLFRLDNALENFQLALELMKEEENKPAISNLLNNIGNIYFDKGDYEKALNFFNQSLELDQNLGNKKNVASSLINIGVVQQSKGDLSGAEKTYEKAVDLNENLGNKKGVSIALNGLGNVNYDWNKFNKALDFYMKSLKIKEDIDYGRGLALTLHNIGNVHKALKNNDDAIKYYLQSVEIAKKLSLTDLLQKNYDALAKTNYKMNNCTKAYEYSNLLAEFGAFMPSKHEQVAELSEREDAVFKSSLVNELKGEIERQKILMKFKENGQKLQLELQNQEIAEQEKVSGFKSQIIYSLVFGILGILFLAFLLMKANKLKKKANLVLKERNAKIELQNNQIVEQKQEIVDSINYAQQIQWAILPSSEIINSFFTENFVLFKPRNIVSGDFYWLSEIENKQIIAVADCTGHGVPGGFMSMLGIAFLKEIVVKEYMTHTGIVLNRLRKEVIRSLKQGEEGLSKDGMDIVICNIDKTTKMMQFSGANNSLYVIRNKEIIELKGDKMPIGIYEKMDKFSAQDFQLETGDLIYMFSDGYKDQFGGEHHKKMKSFRFKETLLNIHQKSMNEQHKILNETFESWRGRYEQVDDVLVFCIKI